ncbi:DUF3077 domain-containing protein [Pseudomonas chlororaphis]|uniref:DUF3077 domain-containing protein n=1 Tax=Pseudomonas chlororaphis TaxID=587753 RepID=UPI0023674AEE|nr:DUF3077 domain-containing protein [Pseudomonas chlororaphis]WDG76202.1 DUF3077 domain-containing protein [Pseudomonas chlororaphis]WDG84559.1 DUF3077 domain-containing protein [Pseudomonas chlororaphis]
MNASTTLGHATFSRVNATDLKLFRVNAGVPVEDALEMVSLLQHHANQLNLDAAMNDNGERFSWAALYLGEMAKALIDDINDALFLPRADT